MISLAEWDRRQIQIQELRNRLASMEGSANAAAGLTRHERPYPDFPAWKIEGLDAWFFTARQAVEALEKHNARGLCS